MLDELGIELIGASIHAIETAEDRELFARAMAECGLRCARSEIIHSVAEAERAVASGTLPLPVVIRPAFTLGGQGGGFASRSTSSATTSSAASPSRRSARCCSRSRCSAGTSSSSR